MSASACSRSPRPSATQALVPSERLKHGAPDHDERHNSTAPVYRKGLRNDAQDAQTDQDKIGPCSMLSVSERPPSENDTDEERGKDRYQGNSETENHGQRSPEACLPGRPRQIGTRDDRQP